MAQLTDFMKGRQRTRAMSFLVCAVALTSVVLQSWAGQNSLLLMQNYFRTRYHVESKDESIPPSIAPVTSVGVGGNGISLLSRRQPQFIQRVDEYFERVSSANVTTNETRWLREYLLWHHDMRIQFPDIELLENPHAPSLWIITHDQAIDPGGLVDRMQCLVEWIEKAYEKQRVILIKWYNSRLPLEAFMVPHLLNFTVPLHPTTATLEQLHATYRSATNSSENQVRRSRCTKVGSFHSVYGFLWNAFFKPSAKVQQVIDETKAKHGLVTGKYDAVHCRFGHPVAVGEWNINLNNDYNNAYAVDSTFLDLARHGIECTEWIARRTYNITKSDKNKVFVYGDSTELVQQVLKLSDGGLHNDNTVPIQWVQLRSRFDVVGRQNASVAHLLNPNKDLPSDAFLSTFVDLYLAAGARCLSINVGRFGFLAVKISDTTCITRYQKSKKRLENKFGMRVLSQVPLCPTNSSI